MKLTKFLPIVFVLALMACNKPAGELVGTGANGNFKEAHPFGMVYIKKGAAMLGSNTQNAIFGEPDNQLMVTVDAFWMDETEITNDEYKQFVNWVRDSIAYTRLVEAGFTEYAIEPKDDEVDEENFQINWKKKIPWNSAEEDIQEALAYLYYPDTKTINTSLYHYRYSWVNYDEASLARNRFDVSRGRYPKGASVRVDTAWVDELNAIHDSTIVHRLTGNPNELVTHMIINIYPDTMVWVRDFEYAYNEPMLLKYFSHPGFALYPVVGVTWEQAHAFCQWRTDFFLKHSTVDAQVYRLPTEAEWEYAARGGRKMATYPWGGNYARDEKGCYLANFKPFRGSYMDDTGTATKQVAQFRPNDFGLFDMAGNVAEWTSSAYNKSTNAYVNDLNPQLQYMARKSDADVLKRKVVKGGSWKDISYYLQCGTRTYEYQYESRSYIGFRCVRSYIGD
ncbi:MAG: SUMF1/EgtB/PvdO family nonheme iron enzyme [Paludibacteraceae bacterium]|nr:SUMF1/EgtB/PvdO family nonheme iron enzyme [Paludibacteraceae bacterium]